MRDIGKLFSNHMDAWGLTLIIGATCLVLHSAVTPIGIALIIALAVCYWLGFAINDYFDAPYDRHEPQKAARNYFVRHDVSHRQFALIFVLGALPPGLVFLQFGITGVLFALIAGLAAWAYSMPPLRLKSRPFLDLVTHMLFVQTFPYFTCLVLLNLTWTPLDYALLSFFLLGSLSAQLEQQARDYDLDRRTDRNFTTQFGLGTTTTLLRVVTALLIANALLQFLSGVIPLRLLPFGLICLPLVLHRFIRRIDEPRSERLIRFTLFAALLYAGLVVSGVAVP